MGKAVAVEVNSEYRDGVAVYAAVMVDLKNRNVVDRVWGFADPPKLPDTARQKAPAAVFAGAYDAINDMFQIAKRDRVSRVAVRVTSERVLKQLRAPRRRGGHLYLHHRIQKFSWLRSQFDNVVLERASTVQAMRVIQLTNEVFATRAAESASPPAVGLVLDRQCPVARPARPVSPKAGDTSGGQVVRPGGTPVSKPSVTGPDPSEGECHGSRAASTPFEGVPGAAG